MTELPNIIILGKEEEERKILVPVDCMVYCNCTESTKQIPQTRDNMGHPALSISKRIEMSNKIKQMTIMC